MKAICLHDKREIEPFLRSNTFLHLFSIGDLDDRYWPYTVWYALKEDGAVKAIALVYTGATLPALHALSEEGSASMHELLSEIYPLE